MITIFDTSTNCSEMAEEDFINTREEIIDIFQNEEIIKKQEENQEENEETTNLKNENQNPKNEKQIMKSLKLTLITIINFLNIILGLNISQIKTQNKKQPEPKQQSYKNAQNFKRQNFSNISEQSIMIQTA